MIKIQSKATISESGVTTVKMVIVLSEIESKILTEILEFVNKFGLEKILRIVRQK